MTTAILIVLGLVLGLVLVVLVIFIVKAGKKKGPPPLPARDLSDLGVKDARRGDHMTVAGAGADFDDLDFEVDRINKYQSGSDEWHELSGTYRGTRVYLEWYEDDVLEVYLNRGNDGPTLRELGVSEEDLGRWDEEPSDTNGFEWDGSKWYWEESCEVGYFKDGKGEGESYYNWTFTEDGGNRQVFVEKWEGEPFEAGVAIQVNPADIRVYSS